MGFRGGCCRSSTALSKPPGRPWLPSNPADVEPGAFHTVDQSHKNADGSAPRRKHDTTRDPSFFAGASWWALGRSHLLVVRDHRVLRRQRHSHANPRRRCSRYLDVPSSRSEIAAARLLWNSPSQYSSVMKEPRKLQNASRHQSRRPDTYRRLLDQ